MQEVKNAAVPYNNVGLLEVRWTPLAGTESFIVLLSFVSRLCLRRDLFSRKLYVFLFSM